MNTNFVQWSNTPINTDYILTTNDSGTIRSTRVGNFPPYNERTNPNPYNPLEIIGPGSRRMPFIDQSKPNTLFSNSNILSLPVKILVESFMDEEGKLIMIYRTTKKPLADPCMEDQFTKEVYCTNKGKIVLLETISGKYVPPKPASYEF